MSYDSTIKWDEEIEAAEKFRKDCSFFNRWEDFEEIYLSGPAGNKKTAPELNLIYMHGRSLLPTLVYTNPNVTNTPRRPEFIPWASFLDSIDNWLVGEMEVERIVKSACLNAYLFNMGAIQVGYDFPSSNYKVTPENVVSSLYGGDPNFPRVPGVVNRARRQNFPYLDLIDPRNLLFPYGTLNLATCRWFGQKRKCFTEDLKKYPELDEKNIRATDYIDKYGIGDPKKSPAECNVTVFYEIHNAVDETYAYIYKDGTYLRDWSKDRLQVDGLNLTSIIFNESTKSIWGTPDAAYVEPQMIEGNECRVVAMKHRKLGFLKGLVDAEIYDESELEKFLDGNTLPFIKAKHLGDKKLTDGIAMVQQHIPQDIYPYMKSIYEDSQLMLGFGYNQMGTTNPGRRTKYEVSVVEDKNALRVSERRVLVAKSLSDIFRKVNQFVVKYWDFPILQRVVGVDGAMYWVEGRPTTFTNLKAELVTSVDVESIAPQSLERTKAELMEIIGLVSRVPNMNVFPLIRQLIAKFPAIDVSGLLPQAVQQGNMQMDQFGQQQQQMMQNPELGGMLKNNLSQLMMAKAPAGGGK